MTRLLQSKSPAQAELGRGILAFIVRYDISARATRLGRPLLSEVA